MLSPEEDMEAQALRTQGWTVSAIACQLRHDRKTVRRYLAGEAAPGRRRRSARDPFEPFAAYCRLRLSDDLR